MNYPNTIRVVEWGQWRGHIAKTIDIIVANECFCITYSLQNVNIYTWIYLFNLNKNRRNSTKIKTVINSTTWIWFHGGISLFRLYFLGMHWHFSYRPIEKYLIIISRNKIDMLNKTFTANLRTCCKVKMIWVLLQRLNGAWYGPERFYLGVYLHNLFCFIFIDQ